MALVRCSSAWTARGCTSPTRSTARGTSSSTRTWSSKKSVGGKGPLLKGLIAGGGEGASPRGLRGCICGCCSLLLLNCTCSCLPCTSEPAPCVELQWQGLAWERVHRSTLQVESIHLSGPRHISAPPGMFWFSKDDLQHKGKLRPACHIMPGSYSPPVRIQHGARGAGGCRCWEWASAVFSAEKTRCRGECLRLMKGMKGPGVLVCNTCSLTPSQGRLCHAAD